MDKRRYVERSPHNPRVPKTIEADETGNAAKDGYSVRSREPLNPRKSPYAWGADRYTVAPSLKDEDEAGFDIYCKD